MDWVFPLAVLVGFIGLWIWYRRFLKSMLEMGFSKTDDSLALPTERWELITLGTQTSQLYGNKAGVVLIPFEWSAGGVGMPLPLYLLYIKGLSFHGHCMSLTDLLAGRHDIRRKSEGERLLDKSLNVYSFGDGSQTAEFTRFVDLHRKCASIEINQSEMIVIVAIPALRKGLEIIESAKATFGI